MRQITRVCGAARALGGGPRVRKRDEKAAKQRPAMKLSSGRVGGAASHDVMVTGQSSTERVFLSGENTAVTGAMVGVYLFRNDRTVAAPADAGPPTSTPS